MRIVTASRHRRNLSFTEEAASDMLRASFPPEVVEELEVSAAKWPAREFAERTLPMACLGDGHLKTVDVFALLLVLFLESGVNVAALRSRLAQHCTYFGMENALCDSRDMAPEFFAMLGVEPPPAQRHHLQQMEFLFPRDFWFPGWQHACEVGDTPQVAVVPGLLEATQGVCQLVARRLLQGSATDRGRQSGAGGAVLLKTPPSFAHWRWGRIQSVVQYLLGRVGAADCTLRSKRRRSCRPQMQHSPMSGSGLGCASSVMSHKRSTFFGRGARDVHATIHREWRARGRCARCKGGGSRMPPAGRRSL